MRVLRVRRVPKRHKCHSKMHSNLNLNAVQFFSLLLPPSRGVRNDASLVPPIRQTASIFKQPVTIYKMQDGKVKDVKHGTPEKPKQVGLGIDLAACTSCTNTN